MERDHDGLRQKLKEEVAQLLNPAERELWSAMQKFIDEQARASGSRERAFVILNHLMGKARETKARQRRTAFRIVKP
jgi:hypothetical protein